MPNYHIVVAAGAGHRFGGPVPKQFCLLWGRPVLMTTLERLHAAAPDAHIIVVLSPGMEDEWAAMCRGYGFGLAHTIVPGGATRAESVRAALRSIPDGGEVGWISIHDAARPMVTPEMFGRLTAALAEGVDGVIPAVAVTDSLREVAPDGSSRAVDRTLYRAVQTPQLFDGPKRLRADLMELRPDFTDDASVMEAAGFTRLVLAEGDPRNIKITHAGDISRIEAGGL